MPARLNVGGQAVLEGVMMRSPRCFAVVVRRPTGEIVIRDQPWQSVWASRLAKIPLVRGAVTLVESLHNGMSALQFSADQLETSGTESEGPTSTPASRAAGLFAIVIAVGFFIVLPQLLTQGVSQLTGAHLTIQHFSFHAITGLCKLALLLGYLGVIRRVPDIRRVFQYHGAEHKAIATYEAGESLTVEHARTHSTRHARCGTTFLLVVVLVSVGVYAVVLPPILRGFSSAAAQALAIPLKVLLLPAVAGLAYELQRLGARFPSNPLARVLLTPGYWVQGITTIEPDDAQLEIALASLRVTLQREAERTAGAPAIAEPIVRSFPTFADLAGALGAVPASSA